MRTTIAIIPEKRIPVLNLYGNAKYVRTRIADRFANGESFPNEQIVRLPRRLGVDKCHCISGVYICSRHFADGSLNQNVI